MILCYNNNKDTFKTYGLELVHAFKNGILRLYDKKQKKFFRDINCKEEAGVKGETILTRATSDKENGMLTEAVLSEGGEVICNDPLTTSNIKRWPKFIQTQRKMTMIQGGELLEYSKKQLQQILDSVSDGNDTIFFKTKSGDFSQMIKTSELTQEDSILRRIISKYPDEEYILSQPINIQTDRLGNKEYRSIIIDNNPNDTPKIASISRYTEDTYHQIPQEVLEQCRRFANMIHQTTQFPDKYVLDIVEYKDIKTGQTRIDILELKPVSIASFNGLYNSVDDLEQKPGKEKSDEQLCHESTYIYDIAPEKKEDFIEKGESPLTTPNKKIVPLDRTKHTKFAEAYELGKKIKKGKTLPFSNKKRQKQDRKENRLRDTGA